MPRTRPHRSVRALRGCARAASLALALAAWACGGCAGPGREVHLAPFVSRLSTAGGGVEVEALAGILQVRRQAPDAQVNLWAVRPLTSTQREPYGDSLTRFLVPLGTRRVRGREKTLQLLPLARYHQEVNERGNLEWQLLMLPGILWSQDDTGRVVRAFFLFGGVIENFLTFDRIVYVLFPLYAHTLRDGRETRHLLFPVWLWSTKPGLRPSWRLWPLYGVSRSENHLRRFWLWPLFHVQYNDLRKPEELRESRAMLFPLLGQTRRASFQSTTVLWPFFGFARDPASGFWAWDGPWPLVRIQRPGESGVAHRTRFWPLWSYFEGDGLSSTWFLWPIFSQREEEYFDGTRTRHVLFPFWQDWTRRDLAGETTGSWRKLWPLFQQRVEAEQERTAFPALNPLWHTPVIDYHYAWIYELYTRERDGERVRERSWGGIWRRELDPAEGRAYLAGIWSRRSYREDDRPVRETSLLFGLLRWRSADGRGTRLLAPAFPGPGWPIARLGEPAR